MRASVIPSAKYSWAGSPERFSSGSTTRERTGAPSTAPPKKPRAAGPETMSSVVTAATESEAHAVRLRCARGSIRETGASGTDRRSRSTSSSRADW